MEEKFTRQLKIAITGPESTGKSVLTAQLAAHFSAQAVPEYARTYLDARGGLYSEPDLLAIARGQVESEKKFEQGPALLFCDTELLVIKIWAQHKYGRVDREIEALARTTRYDYYLLCYPDLPWTSDPQRENPELGKHFFELFRTELDRSKASYFVVKGSGPERLERSIHALNTFFKW